MSRIIQSPSRYIQGPGEIKKLGHHFQLLGSKGAYILMSPSVYQNYREDILQDFKDIPCHAEKFSRECCQKEIDAHIAKIKEAGADVVIGIGGGKTLDTAKAIADSLSLPTIIVPTVASTDAPCTALIVIYTEDGQFERYLFPKANPDMIIMDTTVIVNAPVRLLVAGIGDALATYYEARTCVNANANGLTGGKATKAGMALAELCRDTLFEDGLKAKIAVEQKVCTPAVENIVEATTYLSGVGAESGGLAAAHAIHNGFTILEECHHMYHGEKVAFGTIAQLIFENAPLSEIESVIEFCMSIGLPTTLAALGAGEVTRERLYEVAVASCAEGETIYNSVQIITPDAVFAAIMTADAIGRKMDAKG